MHPEELLMEHKPITTVNSHGLYGKHIKYAHCRLRGEPFNGDKTKYIHVSNSHIYYGMQAIFGSLSMTRDLCSALILMICPHILKKAGNISFAAGSSNKRIHSRVVISNPFIDAAPLVCVRMDCVSVQRTKPR